MRFCVLLLIFRLRDGMSLRYRDWANCSMFVEDLIVVGKNIAAEVPEEHAAHFKEMCKIFARNSSEYDKAIDEHLLQLTLLRSENENAMNANSVPDRSLNRSLDEAAGCSPQSLHRNDPRIRGQKSIPRLPRLVEPRDRFERFEYEIFAIIVQFIHDLDPGMKLFPFGSTQYGIKHPNADYNLLVTTGEFFVHDYDYKNAAAYNL